MSHPLGVTDFGNRERIEPSLFSKVDLQKAISVRLSALSDIAVIGEFPGGAPDVVKGWIDVNDIEAYHDPDSTDAATVRLVRRMKNPSPDVAGAGKIWTARVGDPTQSVARLRDDVRQDLAQAGGAASITLDAAASAIDDFYNGMRVRIVGGLGLGEDKVITDYNGTTKVATVESNWTQQPNNNSTFLVYTPLTTLTSVDYGTHVNKLTASVAVEGLRRRLTLGWKEGTPDEERLVSPLLGFGLWVEYTGSDASAIVVVTVASGVATQFQFATGVLGQEIPRATFALDAVEYNTVQKVAQALAEIADVTVTVAADPNLLSSSLDALSNGSTKRETGTAQAGGASSITLAVGASAADDFYNLREVTITAGTGAGQVRNIADYVGATKVATVDVAWDTQPDNTSVYRVGRRVTTAYLGSIDRWVNETSPRVTSARVTGQTSAPDATTSPIQFAGGTYPSNTIDDWTDALAVLDAEDLPGGFIFVTTSDAAVRAAVQEWIDAQKSVQNKTWRAVLALASGLTSDQIKSEVLFTNHRRIMLVGQRVQDLGPDGVLTTYEPLDVAACLVGMSSGTGVTTPLTGKRIRVRGLVDKWSLADREDLMRSGLTVIKEVKGSGFTVAFALTSSLGPTRMERVWSESMAADYVENNLNVPLRLLVGTWGARDKVLNAQGLAKTVLDRLTAEGVFSEGSDADGNILPPYTNPVARLNAGLLTVTWQGFTGGEVDQIGVLGDIEYQDFEVRQAA